MSVQVTLPTQDLGTVTRDVWAAFLGAYGESALLDAVEPLAADRVGVRAWVTVSGAWEGQVSLEMTSATAYEAAARMLGQASVETEDVLDAVGELVNMVGGNVKSLMPAPSVLGLPVVIEGSFSSAATPDTVECCRADLSWEGTPLRVVVRESHRTPTEKKEPTA